MGVGAVYRFVTFRHEHRFPIYRFLFETRDCVFQESMGNVVILQELNDRLVVGIGSAGPGRPRGEIGAHLHVGDLNGEHCVVCRIVLEVCNLDPILFGEPHRLGDVVCIDLLRSPFSNPFQGVALGNPNTGAGGLRYFEHDTIRAEAHKSTAVLVLVIHLGLESEIHIQRFLAGSGLFLLRGRIGHDDKGFLSLTENTAGSLLQDLIGDAPNRQRQLNGCLVDRLLQGIGGHVDELLLFVLRSLLAHVGLDLVHVDHMVT